MGEKIALDLPDLSPAYSVILTALGELCAKYDVPLVDAEFFAQLAERGGGVLLPVSREPPGVAQ
ncbi:hypothetical protein RKD27_003063 [Streptomyces sp. SAI-126]